MALFKIKTAFESQPFWQQFVIVLLFNSVVAVFLHIFIPGSLFQNQFIMSQSIGVSIFTSFLVLAHFYKLSSWKMLIPLVIGSLIGVTIGITIQAIILNASFELVISSVIENYTNVLSTLFAALFFGTIILIYFAYREKILKAKSRLQAEKITNLDHQKMIAETSLRLLQAQIEPHFLFNTLSNVISLIDTDPQKSKRLLESLTDFLRASLKRSTDIHQHLRNEISLIRNYLAILQIRFGQRLNYTINVADGIDDCAFPPLLLQPLVENAVTHGIEPLTDGGVIAITITKQNQNLVITVTDTGKGLSTEPIKGHGLSNIRDRIQSLYGQNGRLLIEENSPSGVTATIEVPYEPI